MRTSWDQFIRILRRVYRCVPVCCRLVVRWIPMHELCASGQWVAYSRFCDFCHSMILAVISISNYVPCVVRVDNSTTRNVDPTFRFPIHSTLIHTIGLFYTIWPLNATDRQTDTAIVISPIWGSSYRRPHKQCDLFRDACHTAISLWARKPTIWWAMRNATPLDCSQTWTTVSRNKFI